MCVYIYIYIYVLTRAKGVNTKGVRIRDAIVIKHYFC